MAFEEFWPLGAFAAVATITPGGATTLATASGARFGFRRSVPLMAGIAIGLASLAAAAAAGLAGLLLARPSLQVAMKGIGSAYLAWLAWQVGRSGPPRLGAGAAEPTGFLGGACLLWLNPKGWAMALAAVCASRAPLMNRGPASPGARERVEGAFEDLAAWVRSCDPGLTIQFAPGHFNGFFHGLVPPFPVGAGAVSSGDRGGGTGPLPVPEAVALERVGHPRSGDSVI